MLVRKPFRAVREMGLARFLATHVTLAGSLLASMMQGPLALWLVASVVLFWNFEAWRVVLFGVGYASVVAAGIAARARLAGLATLLSLPFYWPLQSSRWRSLSSR